MLRGSSKDGEAQSLLQRLRTNKKAMKGGLGISVVTMFALSSILITQSVQALNKSAGQYGYYGGTYGYGGSTNSNRATSDQVPATVGGVATSVGDRSVTVTWTAVTTTRTTGSDYDNHSEYRVVYGTTAADVITAYSSNNGDASLPAGTSVWKSSNDSALTTRATAHTAISGLTNATTYYFAVYACDTNANCSNAPSAGTSGLPAASSASSGGGGGGSVGSTTPPATTPSTPAAPSTAPSVADINQLLADAQIVSNVQGLLRSIGVTSRNNASEKSYEARIKTVLGKVDNAATLEMLVNFVTYGTVSTQVLGAGERLGVLNSYRAAYGRIPSTEAQWLDVLKIANGRWPSETSTKAEARAKVSFKTIYKHNANMSDAHENAAVTVMAYGLRPANRNLGSEKQAIKNFRGTFGRSPSLATDWDMVRAIAYSGAKR